MHRKAGGLDGKYRTKIWAGHADVSLLSTAKIRSFSLPCVMKAVSVEAKDTIGGREVQKKTHPVVLEKSFTLFSGKIAKIYKIFD